MARPAHSRVYSTPANNHSSLPTTIDTFTFLPPFIYESKTHYNKLYVLRLLVVCMFLAGVIGTRAPSAAIPYFSMGIYSTNFY